MLIILNQFLFFYKISQISGILSEGLVKSLPFS